MRKLCLALALLVPQLALALPAVQVVSETPAIWLIEDHSLPVVSVQMRFASGGAAHDPDDKQGLASIATTLLQEGTESMDAAAWQSYLNAHALDLSVSLESDGVNVRLYCLRKHLAEGMRAMQRMLTRPLLELSALERVRSQHLASLRLSKQSPSYHASRALADILYGEHIYAKASSGTEETLQAITIDDVQHYLANSFNPETVQISVAGSVHPTRIKPLVETVLAALPTSGEAPQEIADVAPISQSQTHGIAFDNPQTTIQFAMPGVTRDDPDFYTAYVLAHMLGGSGLTSYLPNELRQKRGLTYGVSTWVDADKHAAYLRGAFATATATRSEAIEVLNAALNEVYEHGFTQAQRDQSVSYLTGSFPLNLDSTSSLSTYVRLMQKENLGTDYLQKRNSFFASVTLEDINRVAKKLLNPQQRIIVWAGKEQAGE